MKITDEEFELYLEEAIESIDPEFRGYLEEVPVIVDDYPDEQTVERLQLPDKHALLHLLSNQQTSGAAQQMNNPLFHPMI